MYGITELVTVNRALYLTALCAYYLSVYAHNEKVPYFFVFFQLQQYMKRGTCCCLGENGLPVNMLVVLRHKGYVEPSTFLTTENL